MADISWLLAYVRMLFLEFWPIIIGVLLLAIAIAIISVTDDD